MKLILVAHGSRKPAGVTMIGELAERVAGLLDRPVRVAFVDVLGPTPAELLGACRTEPAVLVPAFLARGYHVRADLPRQLIASGHPDVTVTPALGPSAPLVQMLADRLERSGWRPGDSVILAAAGSTDPVARADLAATAAMLSARTGARVEPAFAATGSPRVHEAVARARRRSPRPVVALSYLLADGLFADRVRDSGADVVTAPLGRQPATARLIAGLFSGARSPVPA